LSKLNTLLAASLAGIALAFSISTYAVQNIASPGVYIGAGINPIVLTGHGTDIEIGGSTTLGYRINNQVAIESSYTGFLDSFLTGEIIDVNAKYFLPVTSQWGAFGKLGAAYFHSESQFKIWFFDIKASKTSVTPEVGMGFDYNFTPKFAAEVGISAFPIYSNLVVLPITLGLRYTFD